MKNELTQIKHARSVKEYPDVDLDDDEYVVMYLERSRLGVIIIWFLVATLIVALTAVVVMLTKSDISANSYLSLNSSAKSYLALGIFVLYVALIFCGFAGQSIYNSNKMYITNRRAIQKIRHSLFNNSTNIIELSKIEDVSYRQHSIWDNIFQVGTLRMATVGDETTYTFPFLDTPNDEIDQISKLVQSNRVDKT